jgi:hypothetical protein
MLHVLPEICHAAIEGRQVKQHLGVKVIFLEGDKLKLDSLTTFT